MFELKTQCVVEHVNTRRGKNEDSPVAIDIKLSCDVLPTNCASAALAARGDGEVQQAFFRGTEPRFAGMDVIPIERQYEAKHMVQFNDLEKMRVVKLFNIKLLPLIEGHFAAEFTVTVEEPTAEWLYSIAELQHRSVEVNLEQDVRELDLDKVSDEGKKPGKVKKISGEQPALIN